MSHDYHPPREKFGPLVWDGCDECEERARQGVDCVINGMDPERFQEALVRAWRWQLHGLDDIQGCEQQTIWALAAVLVGLQRRMSPVEWSIFMDGEVV